MASICLFIIAWPNATADIDGEAASDNSGISVSMIAAGDAYLEVSGDSELLNKASQPIALKSLDIGVIRAQ
tara:strand:- start:152 stop:364 length:213 start_codon:yes stop_codon:yes gene_type:complete